MAASGNEALISETILACVQAMVLVPTMPVVMPNRAYTEKPGQPYIAVSLQPNTVDALGIEFGAEENHQGLLQFSVYWPSDAGEVQPKAVVSQIQAKFARGTRINANGIQIRFDYPPSIAAPLSDSDWFMIPVTCRWGCYLPKPS